VKEQYIFAPPTDIKACVQWSYVTRIARFCKGLDEEMSASGYFEFMSQFSLSLGGIAGLSK